MKSPFLVLTLALSSGAVWADKAKTWSTVSDGLAAGLPLVASYSTWQAGDSAGTTQLLASAGSALLASELLKSTVHIPRPDGSDRKSFPSAHTALAFSAAAFMDRRQGESAWTPALYGAAALTGLARVEANKHRWGDVLAGAAIGYGAARYWSEPLQGGRVSVLPATTGLALAWSRTY